MAQLRSPERANQRYRTRKDLLTAASSLMREGRKPTLEEVAEAARVSRATAYRYFPSIDSLLTEASVDITVPDGVTLFRDDESDDPEARIEKAEAALHRAVYDNEPALRVMIASALVLGAHNADGVPVRQNRRLPLIDAALAPARHRLDKRTYARLRAALSLIFGPEAMIVFKDVLRVGETEARDVKRWAIRALVRAAFEQDASPGRESGQGERSGPKPRKQRG
jgi:AcrR family transcriptional regulator